MAKIPNRPNWAVLLFLVFTIGCKDNSAPKHNKLLVAREKINVFGTYEYDMSKIVFTLSAGDKCSIGEERVGKMFAYIEVTCPEKGQGWVVMGDGYEIVDIE